MKKVLLVLLAIFFALSLLAGLPDAGIVLSASAADARLQLNSLSITGGVLTRPSAFDKERTTYWAQPYEGAKTVTITAGADSGISISYKTDGVITTNAIALNPAKRMT